MSQLEVNGIVQAADALVQAGRLPGEGNVDPRFRLKRLVDCRNLMVRLTARERAAALFIASVQLQPELGPMTGHVIDTFRSFLAAKS